MAIDWLHESEIRPGYTVTIEQATFEQKGEVYKPREVQKGDRVTQMKVKAEQDKQKAWEDEELHDSGLKIIVLQGFYTQTEVEQAKQGQVEPETVQELVNNFFKELEEEIRMEIESKVGPLGRVEFFKENPLGICKLRFQSSLHAEACITLMHDRFFDSRKLRCWYWDGKADYKVVHESKEVENERVDQFGEWLEGQQLPEEFQVQQEVETTIGNKLKEKRDAKLKEKAEGKLNEKPLMMQDQDEEFLDDESDL